jgi:hypothetical protein
MMADTGTVMFWVAVLTPLLAMTVKVSVVEVVASLLVGGGGWMWWGRVFGEWVGG